MRLPEAIAAAQALTRRLHEALVASDLEAAASLLAARAEAMTDFEDAHRNADDRERTACAPQLADLQAGDRALQEAAAETLAAADEAWRANVGATPVYDDESQLACLDRRV